MFSKIARFLNGSLINMTEQFTLHAFEQRALQAEGKLQALREQMVNLHQDLIVKEEKRLKLENQQLLSKVSSLREKLVQVEQANGQQEFAIPKPTEKTVTPQPQQVQEKTKESKPKQVNNASEKKQKDTGKEAKQPKQQKKQEAAPVDVSRLDMRVAQIMTVKHHPDADSLYLEEIETGEETRRTVVTGLVNHVPIEQMQDRMVVLMCNLKPAKMRGIVSQAMVMCANCPENVEIIDPPPGSVPGDRIVFEGYPGKPDNQLNPKKKVWERIQPDLHTNGECVACYKGVPFSVEGKGVCKVQTLSNCGIK